MLVACGIDDVLDTVAALLAGVCGVDLFLIM
jgi:hypothetical protein